MVVVCQGAAAYGSPTDKRIVGDVMRIVGEVSEACARLVVQLNATGVDAESVSGVDKVRSRCCVAVAAFRSAATGRSPLRLQRHPAESSAAAKRGEGVGAISYMERKSAFCTFGRTWPQLRHETSLRPEG